MLLTTKAQFIGHLSNAHCLYLYCFNCNAFNVIAQDIWIFFCSLECFGYFFFPFPFRCCVNL